MCEDKLKYSETLKRQEVASIDIEKHINQTLALLNSAKYFAMLSEDNIIAIAVQLCKIAKYGGYNDHVSLNELESLKCFITSDNILI